MTAYDPENILAKILRGEIPCDKVLEDDHCLAIRDINPQAPSHILVIPKGAYHSFDALMSEGSDAEIIAFQKAIAAVIKSEDLTEGGYRLVMNNGLNSGQEIPHLHCHILGGSRLGSIA